MDTGTDTYFNEILATGATMACLEWRGTKALDVQPVIVDGQATNELYVWFDFLKSRYRLTITLDPE